MLRVVISEDGCVPPALVSWASGRSLNKASCGKQVTATLPCQLHGINLNKTGQAEALSQPPARSKLEGFRPVSSRAKVCPIHPVFMSHITLT